MNLSPDLVRQMIANLLLQHPELLDDDEARALSIESETPAVDWLRVVEGQRRNAAAMAGAIADTIANLEIRQERFVKQEAAFRRMMKDVLQSAQIPKLVLPEATLSISKGRVSAAINDPASVPAEYCHPPVLKPDMAKIKAALEAGEKFNWAALVQGEQSLSIRTK